MDIIGTSTLEKISQIPRFNHWMFSQYCDFIRWGKIWEIGSGIGNMSGFLLNADLLCVSDYDEYYQNFLKKKYSEKKNVVVQPVDLKNLDIKKFQSYGFDTIISTNVLEHIEDDAKAFADLAKVMNENTVLITLVPAHPLLYNDIDRGLGHYRRYTKEMLADLCIKSNQEVIKMSYFNRISVLPWIFRKIIKTKSIPQSDLKIMEYILPIAKMEKFLPLPFGQSILLISKKKIEN